MIHFKIPSETHDTWGLTALNRANENEDTDSAREILRIEHLVHKNKKEGLDCLKVGFLSFAPYTVIALFLLCFIFATSSLLLFLIALSNL